MKSRGSIDKLYLGIGIGMIVLWAILVPILF